MCKKILIWIWCFPQMLLGFVISRILKLEKNNDVYIWEHNGLSLGEFIFVRKNVSEEYIRHEKGHTKQSYILGWLYLIVIGVPSLIWNTCFERYRTKNNVSYYSFYTEKWADKLSGIERW